MSDPPAQSPGPNWSKYLFTALRETQQRYLEIKPAELNSAYLAGHRAFARHGAEREKANSTDMDSLGHHYLYMGNAWSQEKATAWDEGKRDVLDAVSLKRELYFDSLYSFNMLFCSSRPSTTKLNLVICSLRAACMPSRARKDRPRQ